VGFLDKAKQAAEQAAAKAKEGVEDVQTKRELGQAYGDLGRTAYELVSSGELSHPRLDRGVERVRALLAKAEAADAAPAYDASQPPAMPT
jgi:hypothetical protein